MGRHLHDDGGLWGHGAAEHSRPGGGAQQHPERDSAHGLPRHVHLPHFLTLLPGAQGGAVSGVQAEARLAGQHQVPE